MVARLQSRMASSPATRWLTLLVILSAVLMLVRSGPLHGSTIALGLTVILQLYLPGYLLARVMGKHHIAHPILRFVWVLVCGLSLTITLGAAAYLFTVPVYLYLIVLHGIMLALVWLPPGEADHDLVTWHFERRFIPLYLVVLAACLVGMIVSYSSRYRFYGFEDQVIFASHAGWIANNPGETPLDQPLRARRIGAIDTRDTRFDTDGWTYNHAAWVWSSGVSATQLIWYELNPLFVWTVPLIVFALAYELTRREEAATWAAAGLMIVGLLTLDNLVFNPNFTAYGRFAFFQINVLRQASLTFMLPLCLLVSLTYFRTTQRRDWLMMALSGVTLAILHPIVVMLLALSIGSTAVLHQWFGRRRWLPVPVPVILALIVILTLPMVQRLNRSGGGAADTQINTETVEQAETSTVRGEFLIIPDAPIVGATFIRNPERVFYHPAVLLAAVLGLLFVVRIRESLAAQYIFGATLTFLLIAFVPGLTALVNAVASSVGLYTTSLILPIALIYGLALDAALRRIPRDVSLPASAGAVALAGVLLFEPFPIAGSPHDQLMAYNELQESRRLLPSHEKLSARLQELLPPSQTTVLMAEADTTSIIIEDLPRALVTGGRSSSNKSSPGDSRFFNRSESAAPWLDSADLDFMNQYTVTHVIIRADESRAPQLALQPERFQLLDTVDGLQIFAWNASVPADAIDALFGEMNALYAEIIQPRWGPMDGFALVRPGDPARWRPIAAQWEVMLAEDPEHDRMQLGLAFAHLMAGDDDRALPVWETLHSRYPNLTLVTEALAYTHQILGEPEAGYAVLLDVLNSDDAASRAIAAKTLLSATFFYLLNDSDLESVILTADDPTWDYLVFFDQPDLIRQQAALLMMAHRWETAARWLDHVPSMMVSPRDLTAQATTDLAQGFVDGALARLQPTTDPDWRTAKAFFQSDRWQSNHAARIYYLLLGDIALQEGRLLDAAAAYQQAIDEGATLPGLYFRAQALEHAGESAEAAQARAALGDAWNNTAPFPELDPLLSIAESTYPYVMNPIISQDESASTLTVTATYGGAQPHVGYPFEFWRYEIINPDASAVYLTEDVLALLLDDALIRQAVTLPLPDVDPLTPALVLVRAGYNNSVMTTPAITAVTLNRPDDPVIPDDAIALDLRFGDAITLESYMLNAAEGQVELTLYWQTAAPLPEDYQIFVHVLDANGEIIAQNDTAPVNGRYPTGQWRTGVTIEDAHSISVPDLPDSFSVRLGMYRLLEGTRLPITPVDDRIESDSLLLG